jgi:poly-gamma-glutamate capsule biosynthesis protein CapA/YwtB (metallophosphatase superfamily)
MSPAKCVLPSLAVALLALANIAAADSVAGRVVDESGAGLSAATVALQNTAIDVGADGGFSFRLDSPTTLTLRVEAPGYYTFVHTLHRSDFASGLEAIVPDIRLVQRKPGRTLFVFAGDAMLSRRYFEPRAGEPVLLHRDSILDDGKKLLASIRPYIELADFASVNMETQLSDEPLTDRVPKSVTFYSPQALATLLQWAGFDYVALGNNHLYDYRDAGLAATFAALAETSLAYSGAGANETEARQAASVELAGGDHRFLSYVGWAGTFEPSQVAAADKGGAALGYTEVIAEDLAAQPEGAVSVLQLHAGLEYAEAPALSEQTTFRQAIKDGADIAVGHHPHVLQGFEIVDDRLIAYSLGNFLFDQYHYTTQLGMLLYVWMDGDTLHRAEAVPLHVNGYIPTPATGLFRHAVLTRLARLSHASVCMTPSGFHAVITRCEGTARASSRLTIPSIARAAPIHLRSLGASPLRAVQIDPADGPYRLGIDLLRRGDFEYARLFGAHDRSWIMGRHASLKTGDNNRLDVRVPAGGQSVRTGMKVFERVFSLSSPATVAGRLRVDGKVRIRFLLQRRRETDTLDDALANGPVSEIGVWEGSVPSWTTFSFDYNQPRIATRSIRLLMEFVDSSDDKSGATVMLDDLAWVEWRTPWIGPGDVWEAPLFATHLMLQAPRKP